MYTNRNRVNNYRSGLVEAYRRDHGQEVATEHPSFRIVRDLAGDLNKGGVSFPTFINATVKIHRVLNDPQVNTDRVTRTVSAEPLLAAKLVQLANSAALGMPGKPVADIKGAVLRVGYSNVNAVAATVAMAQLVAAKEMQPFLKASEAVWSHSLDVAAIAFVLAKKLTRLSADAALFAGLVHDLGRFYLLSKLPKYPELIADPGAIEAVLDDWHASVGHAILVTFKLPDAVLDAISEHESDQYPKALRTLTDVITAANLLSKCPSPLGNKESDIAPQDEVQDPNMLEHQELLEAAAEELMSVVVALRA